MRTVGMPRVKDSALSSFGEDAKGAECKRVYVGEALSLSADICCVSETFVGDWSA